MIIINGWKPLTIITKHYILDVAAALDPPLSIHQPKQSLADVLCNSSSEVLEDLPENIFGRNRFGGFKYHKKRTLLKMLRGEPFKISD